MFTIYPFDYTKHRFFNETPLDLAIDNLCLAFIGKDDQFSDILTRSKSDIRLRIALKVIIDNGLFDPGNNIHRDRLVSELTAILNHKYDNLLDYFMLFEDLAFFFNSKNILNNIGRGTATSCFFNYLLGITKINPLHFDLPFARFFSKNKVPSIDFEGLESSDLLSQLTNTYGSQNIYPVAYRIYYKASTALVAGNDDLEHIKAKNRVLFGGISKIRDAIRKYERQPPFVSISIEEEKNYFLSYVNNDSELCSFFTKNPILKEFILNHVGTIKSYGISTCRFVLCSPNSCEVDAKIMLPQGNPAKLSLAIKKEEIERLHLTCVSLLSNTGYRQFAAARKTLSDFRLMRTDDAAVFKKLCNSTGTNNLNSRFQPDFKTYKELWQDDEFPPIKPDPIIDKISSLLLFTKTPQVNSILDMSVVMASCRPTRLYNSKRVDPGLFSQNIDDVLSTTNNYIIFQEQIMEILSLGNLSLEDARAGLNFFQKPTAKLLPSIKSNFINAIGAKGNDLWNVLALAAPQAILKSHALSVCYKHYALAYFNIQS